MKILTNIPLFLVFSMALFKSSGQEVISGSYGFMLDKILSHSVKEISVSDVTEDVIFIDAREKSEFDVSKIKGAVWVGYDDFELSRMLEISKDQKLVVYCSVGYRSEKIAEKLIDVGYKDVSNLYGGIFEWVNQDQPVVNQLDETTNRVHAFSRVWGVWLNKGDKVY